MSGKISEFATRFKIIHWVMAVLILTMLIAGQNFGGPMPEDERRFSLAMHATLGVFVILLLIRRLRYVLSGRAQRPEHDLPGWQKSVSRLVQYGIYAMLVFVPVTGILTAVHSKVAVKVFGLFNIAQGDASRFDVIRPFHETGTKILAVLLVLHVGAALYHGLIRRDGVFRSMWFRRRMR